MKKTISRVSLFVLAAFASQSAFAFHVDSLEDLEIKSSNLELTNIGVKANCLYDGLGQFFNNSKKMTAWGSLKKIENDQYVAQLPSVTLIELNPFTSIIDCDYSVMFLAKDQNGKNRSGVKSVYFTSRYAKGDSNPENYIKSTLENSIVSLGANGWITLVDKED